MSRRVNRGSDGSSGPWMLKVKCRSGTFVGEVPVWPEEEVRARLGTMLTRGATETGDPRKTGEWRRRVGEPSQRLEMRMVCKHCGDILPWTDIEILTRIARKWRAETGRTSLQLQSLVATVRSNRD